MRNGSSLSLLFLDVDHFKAFNDANGHQVGDDSLRTVARRIANSVQRAGDLVARYGGEELAVILAGTEKHEALAVPQRICSAVHALRLPHPANPSGPYLTISIGAATAMTTTGGTLEMPQGLQAADLALYKTKANARSCVESSLVLTARNDLKVTS